MHSASQGASGNGQTKFVQLGGLALLVGFAIHIIANSVIKRFPPEDPSLDQLRAYLTAEVDSWALVHGVRYIAIVSIAVFAAALFARTCCTRVSRPVGWGVVGLLGATMWLANLFITNGIETFVFLGPEIVSANADLFWAFFKATRVLFTAEIVAWGVLIGGFSVAGWLSDTLPKWLCAFGLVPATFGILSGVFVVSILTDGWATWLIIVASLCGLAWFVCAGFYLLLRGDS